MMMKDLNTKHFLQRNAFLFLLQRLALSKVFPKVSFEEGNALVHVETNSFSSRVMERVHVVSTPWFD